jgi:type IV pilus assembly protein PilA
MTRFAIVIVLLTGISAAQTAAPPVPPPPPQTARQALLEMFLREGGTSFEKHLPTATQDFLKTNHTVPFMEISEMSRELHQPTNQIETFDDGPILMRMRNQQMEQTIEIRVDSESDSGDEYELRLSLQVYRAGRPVPIPFLPTFTCLMKMESSVWRLNEFSFNGRIPIGDTGFLEALSHRLAASRTYSQESSALHALRSVAIAQASYAAAFPNLGFACSLSALGGDSEGAPTPRAARMVERMLSSGSVDGYTFEISDCSGSPTNHYRVSAVPDNSEADLRAFCADETGKIRYADGGQAGDCLSSGDPLP